GATAVTFLLPLVVGISVTSFVLTTAIAISPDQHEIRAEVDLRARISRRREPEETYAAPAAASPPPTRAGSRASQAIRGRRQAASGARRDDPRPR
ncbi:MAG TPA: hypothetical protein VHW06_04785, partial [Streptosporangiaceae bacterium]|nr:hypothetical protein [Streptosporangiaceae bacterium]